MDALLPALLDLATRSADAAEFQRQALDEVRRAIDCEVAFAVTGAGGLAAPALIEPSIARSRAAFERELWPVKRLALDRCGVAVDTEVLGHGRQRRSNYFRDLMQPFGLRSAMLCFPTLRGRVAGVLSLAREGRFHRSEVARVEAVLPAFALGLASFGGARRSASAALALSLREQEVVDLVCLGYTNREIALALGTSPNTVRNQLASVFQKIGATSRAELVALARRA